MEIKPNTRAKTVKTIADEECPFVFSAVAVISSSGFDRDSGTMTSKLAFRATMFSALMVGNVRNIKRSQTES